MSSSCLLQHHSCDDCCRMHQHISCFLSRNVDETHAIAQRKVAQMDKLRTVFGFSADQDKKEGEAFDRELQEKRKRDRLLEIEQREKAKVKKAKEAEKEKKRREKERKRSVQKAEKEKKKQERQREKVCKPTSTS